MDRGTDVYNYSYKIEEIQDYNLYVGRLKVGLKKPSRGKAFRLEKHLGDMVVLRSYSYPTLVRLSLAMNALIMLSRIFARCSKRKTRLEGGAPKR